MPTVAELLSRQQTLAGVSDSALLDTEIILAHALGKDRSYLRGWPEADIEGQPLVKFEALLARRQAGEPVAYLTGTRGFWSLELKVSPATLIPRPETELLVEKVLDLFPDSAPQALLDLGTGTGAIALALASELPQTRVLGCDVQPEAVALAEDNRQQCGFENVRFIQSDWFDALGQQHFDCIVSNPPYIDSTDPHLQQGDVRFEPLSALVAGKQGLAAIEQITGAAPAYLSDRGWLLFEHGYQQGLAVREILQGKGFMQVQTFKDLAGHDRVTMGSFCGEGGVAHE